MLPEEFNQNKIDILDMAKQYKNEGRKWLEAGFADSYKGKSNRVNFWVLEGSPPRGFILFWPERLEALRLRSDGTVLKRFNKFLCADNKWETSFIKELKKI